MMQADTVNVEHKFLYCAGRNQSVVVKARGPFGNDPSIHLIPEIEHNTTKLNVLSEQD